jgi:hypothetical protein
MRAKPKPAVDPRWKQRIKLIEEYATLDRAVRNFKPLALRHEKLRNLILEWHSAVRPEDEATLRGKSCDIIISSRDKVRSVTLAGRKALYKLWGPRDFIARSVVLLKSLPDPKDESSLYTVQAPTGPRHLQVIDREEREKAVPAA